MIPEFYTRDENGIPTAWVKRMRASMAQLTPRFSANRSVREYTEHYYLPSAAAYRLRSADKGTAGRQVIDWRRSLEQNWAVLHFGEVKVETQDEQHLFQVQVYLGDLDPEAVEVELYADSRDEGGPVRQTIQPIHHLAGSVGGYAYSATVPAGRPATDYTARVIPRREDLAVPLEEGHILWQR